jgi:hypothetical protein
MNKNGTQKGRMLLKSDVETILLLIYKYFCYKNYF